jgi:hypothetical protein
VNNYTHCFKASYLDGVANRYFTRLDGTTSNRRPQRLQKQLCHASAHDPTLRRKPSQRAARAIARGIAQSSRLHHGSSPGRYPQGGCRGNSVFAYLRKKRKSVSLRFAPMSPQRNRPATAKWGLNPVRIVSHRTAFGFADYARNEATL